MKNFSKEAWNIYLNKKDWNQVSIASDLDSKVKTFEDLMEEVMNEVAPIKCVVILLLNGVRGQFTTHYFFTELCLYFTNCS